MGKLMALVGSTVGGAIGWWAGAYMGTMTAFMLSMIGTGLGLYFGKRLADEYLS